MERRVQLRNSVISGVLFFTCSCQTAPGKVDESDVLLTREKGFYYYNGELYSGTLLQYDSLGNPAGEISLQAGKRNGTSFFYWPNGNLKREANYKDDVYDGEVKQYFETGTLYSHFNYVNGQESGLQRMWKSDGRIKVNYEVIDGRKYGLTGVKNCVNVLDEEGSHY